MAQKKKSIVIYLLGSIIFILSGIVIYLVLNQNNQKTVVVQNETIIQNDSLEIATKLEEFKLAGEALKKLKEEMLFMGINKDSIGSELNELLEALWEVEMGGAISIDNLNSKIARAKNLFIVKDLQIKLLKEKSDSLSFEEKVLKGEKEARVQQISEMLNDNRGLSAKLNLAARLKAEHIKINAVTKKEKLLEKELYKVKELNKLSVSFTIADNKFAKIDKKCVFIFRLLEGGNTLIYNEKNGGGLFKTTENIELPYTDKQVVVFDNTGQQITFLYKKGSDYAAGSYKIELYTDCYLIGESTFQVK